jgi:hypothetical protein
MTGRGAGLRERGALGYGGAGPGRGGAGPGRGGAGVGRGSWATRWGGGRGGGGAGGGGRGGGGGGGGGGRGARGPALRGGAGKLLLALGHREKKTRATWASQSAERAKGGGIKGALGLFPFIFIFFSSFIYFYSNLEIASK